jgi:hypothetical protein
MKNPPQNNNHITVDGVTYDVNTGRALYISKKQNLSNTDIIAPKPSLTTADISLPQRSKPMGVIDLPQKKKFLVRKPKNSKNVKPAMLVAKKRSITAQKNATKPSKNVPHSFGWFIGRALLPRGFSASAWIFSFLRGVTSPLAWFLAALPVLILELQNVVFENINNLLSRAHLVSQNGLVFRSTPVIIATLTIAITILFVRVLFNAIAMHLRNISLAGRTSKLWPAIKLVLHNSLKIIINGAIQIFFILITGLASATAFYWLVRFPHGETLTILVPYLAGLIVLVWFGIMCLLHAKHWLQIAILSSSNQTSQIQRRSFNVIFNYPLRSALLALLSFVLTIGICVYGGWAAFKTIEWLNQTTVPSNSRFVLIISSIFLLAVLVSYIQQTIWSAYGSWLNQQYVPRLFKLASDEEAKSSNLWPFWVSIYLVIMTIALASLFIVFILPVINTHIVNISTHLPDKIDIPKVK